MARKPLTFCVGEVGLHWVFEGHGKKTYCVGEVGLNWVLRDNTKQTNFRCSSCSRHSAGFRDWSPKSTALATSRAGCSGTEAGTVATGREVCGRSRI